MWTKIIPQFPVANNGISKIFSIKKSNQRSVDFSKDVSKKRGSTRTRKI